MTRQLTRLRQANQLQAWHWASPSSQRDYARHVASASGLWLLPGTESLARSSTGSLIRRHLARGGVIGGPGAAPWITGVTVALSVDSRQQQHRRSEPAGGRVGVYLERGAAVEATGRRLTVLGQSNGPRVAIALAAGAGRPASLKWLQPGERVDLIALRRAAIERTQSAFPNESPRPPMLTRGALLIAGGDHLPPSIWEEFVRRAGGRMARIVLIPTARGDPMPHPLPEIALLKKAGAQEVRVVHSRDRRKMWDPTVQAALRRATGIWFSGGRQWRLVDVYAGTPAEKHFHALLQRGGIIGGTSAGASIQAEYLVRGEPLTNTVLRAEGYEHGLGFLPGVAIDPHFSDRQRHSDMVQLLSWYPQLLGVGIDEGTALLVRGSTAEVMGRQGVHFYDRRSPSQTLQIERLHSGDRYDLLHRRRLVGGPSRP